MSLSDIFSIPFLICISICVLLIGCSSIYFYQKISQQDHKIASMVGLLSTMAEETSKIHEFHHFLQTGGQMPVKASLPESLITDKLINVSDDEEDDESDEDESDEDDSKDENDDSSSEISHTTEEDDNVDDIGSVQNKNIYINLINDHESNILGGNHEFNIIKNQPYEDLDVEEELESDTDSESDGEDDLIHIECNDDDDKDNSDKFVIHELNLEEIEDIDIDESEHLEESIPQLDKSVHLDESAHLDESIQLDSSDFSNLKTINIDDSFGGEMDYKKMNITRLRKIMQDKGIADANKLKKPEIFKILGIN